MADVPDCCEIKDAATISHACYTCDLQKGVHIQGGPGVVSDLRVGGTTVSILTYVVDAKLTGVTGCLCVCAVLEPD